VGPDSEEDTTDPGRGGGGGGRGEGGSDDNGGRGDDPGRGGGSGGGAGAGAGGGGDGDTIAFEAEGLAVTDSGTGTRVDTDVNASEGRWVALAAENAGSWMEFALPPMPGGTYAFSLRWKGNTTRAIATIRLDGEIIGEPLDQYSPSQSYPTASVATVSLDSTRPHAIRLQVTGQNPASSSFILSADRLIFQRQR
jgi:hypothetical protein